jgi:hypothetical protein
MNSVEIRPVMPREERKKGAKNQRGLKYDIKK